MSTMELNMHVDTSTVIQSKGWDSALIVKLE